MEEKHSNLYKQYSEEIISECDKTLKAVDVNSVDKYIEMVLKAKCIFFIGVGRVLFSLEAIAKRYNHIGLNSIVVGQVTEPAITKDDVLIVGSGSGERIIPCAIAKKAKELGAKVIHIGSVINNPMDIYTDLFVRIPAQSVKGKTGEIISKQPMTSLFEQCLFLFGDITAMIIIEKKGLVLDKLWKRHANLE